MPFERSLAKLWQAAKRIRLDWSLELLHSLSHGSTGTVYCTTLWHTADQRDKKTILYVGVFLEPQEESLCFGLLKLVIANPQQCALVAQVNTSGRSLMQQAGPPCRGVLQAHRDLDLLRCHIRPVSGTVSCEQFPCRESHQRLCCCTALTVNTWHCNPTRMLELH